MQFFQRLVLHYGHREVNRKKPELSNYGGYVGVPKRKRLPRSKTVQASVIPIKLTTPHSYTVMISFSFWVSTSSIFLI
jgi:hypothetical protein